MRIRIRTVLAAFAALVGAAIVALVVVAKSVDLDEYRGWIADKVEASTGRKLTISGPVGLNLLTLTPSIEIADVAFANASWGSRPEMMRVRRLETQVALLPLLSKRIEVRRFVLVEPEILLETDRSGRGNWSFAAAPPAPGAPAAEPERPGAAAPSVVVAEVRIENGRLTYRNGATGKETKIGLDRLVVRQEGADTPLKLEMAGTYNGAPFAGRAELGSLAALDVKAPYPLALEAQAGGATIAVKGAIKAPREGKGIDVTATAEGKDLADLGPLAGTELPRIGPYEVAAHIADDDGTLRIERFKARLGRSDLAGEIALSRGERPALRATLTSTLVDLNELAPAGGKREAKAGEAAPGAKADKEAAGEHRLFSDEPLPLAGLKAVNAEAKLAAAKVVTRGPELANVDVTLVLKDGRLSMKPASATVASGRVETEVALDAAAAQPALSLAARATDLDVAALAQQMGIKEKVSGKADFTATAKGKGASVRAIMAGLDGRTDLSIGEMRVDNTLMKIVMADLAKAVVGQGDASKINCVVSRFDIAKGLATSKALVVDTESVTIRGSGTVNLATERLDMRLDPSPKAAAIVDLAVPVKIGGSLASPSVAPDPAALAKKLGGVATGVAGAATGGGVVEGLLGAITGDKATAGAQPRAAANPCLLADAGAAPAKASGAPSKSEPAPPPEPAKPAESPIEDLGKKLKGLFE